MLDNMTRYELISKEGAKEVENGGKPSIFRAGRRRSDVADAPDQRDVEGLGGQFWYEARMGGGP